MNKTLEELVADSFEPAEYESEVSDVMSSSHPGAVFGILGYRLKDKFMANIAKPLGGFEPDELGGEQTPQQRASQFVNSIWNYADWSQVARIVSERTAQDTD